jgi:hypothetical protein
MERVGHRQHVGRQHLVELREIFVVLGLDADRDAGVGDHDVDAAGRLLEVARGGDQRVLVGDVHAVDAVTASGQRRGERVERLDAPCRQPQRRAACGEFLRQRRADAARRSSDEHAHRHAPQCTSQGRPPCVTIGPAHTAGSSS